MAVLTQKCPKCGKAATFQGHLRDVPFYDLDLQDVEALAHRYNIAELITIHDALVLNDPYFYCDGPGGCGEGFSYSDSYPDARRMAVAQFLFGPKS